MKPCTFKYSYCDDIKDHLEQGYSVTSFAGVIGVNTQTLYNWFKKFPEFKEAKDIGVNMSLLFWEKKGIENLHNKNFGWVGWIFNMKNRFGWRDKVELSGDEESPIQVSGSLQHKTKEELMDQVRAFSKKEIA